MLLIALAYHFPEAQIYLTEDWLKSIKMDLVETLKRMLMPEKTLEIGQLESMTLQV